MKDLTFERLPQAVNHIREQLDELMQVLKKNPATTMMPDKPVNQHQLCEFLNISHATCSRWRKKKVIPFMRIGASIRYDLNAVVEALQNKKRGTA